MITLYHCDGARSFRPLWMLEEMGLPYELKMLPFPPRVFAKEYLATNPLGTIPFMIDGETKMIKTPKTPGTIEDHGTLTGTPFGRGKVGAILRVAASMNLSKVRSLACTSVQSWPCTSWCSARS